MTFCHLANTSYITRHNNGTYQNLNRKIVTQTNQNCKYFFKKCIVFLHFFLRRNVKPSHRKNPCISLAKIMHLVYDEMCLFIFDFLCKISIQ
ncbi:MAG TPA: hypothetical protein DCY74_03190 [Clostridiales bacterium]|nr:hypothetical protein [Clostridiales bacterium]HCG35018.1 hypothetical protein [Clostridiales bacterium]